MELSVIVPLYNEEESVRPLFEAIVAALEPLRLSFEVVFVDDGSRDRTFAIAKELAGGDRRLRVIRFRRNYGQTPAMVAGIEHSRGGTLVTMDGDLQNDPADIPHFLDKMREGYDIVVGWRHQRKDKLITRKIPSRIANWLIGRITQVPIKDNGCSLKAYRREVIQNIPLYSEMHRFIPAMSSLAGTRIAEIKVSHRARAFGQSKYGLSRVYKVLLDLIAIRTILSVLSRPLLVFALLAIGSVLVGVLGIIAGLVNAIIDPQSDTIVLVGLALLYSALAVALFAWGILAELICRTGDLSPAKFADLTLRTPSFLDTTDAGTTS